jgi:hypothetical protein
MTASIYNPCTNLPIYNIIEQIKLKAQFWQTPLQPECTDLTKIRNLTNPISASPHNLMVPSVNYPHQPNLTCLYIRTHKFEPTLFHVQSLLSHVLIRKNRHRGLPLTAAPAGNIFYSLTLLGKSESHCLYLQPFSDSPGYTIIAKIQLIPIQHILILTDPHST